MEQKKRKPSEQIKAFLPAIAQQRLQQMRAQINAGIGPATIMTDAEVRNALAKISADPLTWIIALLAYLDEEAEKKGAAGAPSNESSLIV